MHQQQNPIVLALFQQEIYMQTRIPWHYFHVQPTNQPAKGCATRNLPGTNHQVISHSNGPWESNQNLQSPPTWLLSDIEELVRLWNYKNNLESIKQNKNDGDDGHPEKCSNTKSRRKIIETMEKWIHDHHGLNNFPLSYVLRTNENVPCIADDPLPLRQPTYNAELIRRTLH